MSPGKAHVMARKLKDFDAQLAALKKQEKKLREARVIQFGELVCATGADALKVEALVGLLLEGVAHADKDAKMMERWAARGRDHFQSSARAKADSKEGGDAPAGAASKSADTGSPAGNAA